MIKLSIRYKLLLSFIGVALLSVPFNIYLMINFNKVTQNFLYLTNYQLPGLQALVEIKNTVLRVTSFISNFNYSVEQIKGNQSTPTKLGATKDQLLAYLEEIGEWEKKFQQHLLPTEQNKLIIAKLDKLKTDVILKALDVFSSKETSANTSLVPQIRALEQAQSNLEIFINNQLQAETDALNLTKEKATKSWFLLQILVITVSLLVLSVACVIGFLLSRWISTPVIALRNFTYAINYTNLDVKTPILSNDEIGELAISINSMLANLSHSQSQLIEASRLAGVAEIATSVIHNVGNVLNSINTSTVIISQMVNKSKIDKLSELYSIFVTHKEDLNEFIHNEQGQRVLPYFQKLVQTIKQEQRDINKEINYLQDNLNQIKMLIKLRLSERNSRGIIEKVNIESVIEAALILQAAAIHQNHIMIIRNYSQVLTLFTVRSKLQQIIINLVKNAIEALIESSKPEKMLTITVETLKKNELRIIVTDNGIGILKKMQDKIFSFGFTTKQEGHGYGLHSCALLAVELNGSLTVKSKGLNQGASFLLDIPNMTL